MKKLWQRFMRFLTAPPPQDDGETAAEIHAAALEDLLED